jgi:hypothetical protein
LAAKNRMEQTFATWEAKLTASSIPEDVCDQVCLDWMTFIDWITFID